MKYVRTVLIWHGCDTLCPLMAPTGPSQLSGQRHIPMQAARHRQTDEPPGRQDRVTNPGLLPGGCLASDTIVGSGRAEVHEEQRCAGPEESQLLPPGSSKVDLYEAENRRAVTRTWERQGRMGGV